MKHNLEAQLDRCHQALNALRECRERERKALADDPDALSRLEGEAPAPDPCTEHYNEAIAAIVAYEGPLEDIDFGDLHEELHNLAKARREA
jgi:hypothetical protein